MLALVLVEIVLVTTAIFMLWNIWGAMLAQRKIYNEADIYLKQISDYKDAEALRAKNEENQRELMFRALLISFAVVLAVLLFSSIARATFIQNHTHKYDSSVTAAATCVKEGLLSYQCKFCDEKYTEPIPMMEHSFVESSVVEATCIAEGDMVSVCEICGRQQHASIPMTEHTYEEFGRIEKEGLVIYSCQVCGIMDYETILRCDSHTWGTWTVKKRAGFSEAGEKCRVCLVCGETALAKNYDKILVIPGAFAVIVLLAISLVYFLHCCLTGIQAGKGAIVISSLLAGAGVCLIIWLRTRISEFDEFWLNVLFGILYSAVLLLLAGLFEIRTKRFADTYPRTLKNISMFSGMNIVFAFTLLADYQLTIIIANSVLLVCILIRTKIAFDDKNGSRRGIYAIVVMAQCVIFLVALNAEDLTFPEKETADKSTGRAEYAERTYYSGVYKGEWLNELPNGYGEYYWEDGTYFEGQWVEGQRIGEGQLYDPSGTLVYKGEFLNGSYSGHGTLYTDDGIYIGGFDNGMQHGYGEYYEKDGNIYRGSFFEDRRTGEGIMLYSDGSKYVGSFLNDHMHGYGEIYSPDGNILFKGYIVENQDALEAEGEFLLDDGSKYVGSFFRSLLNDDVHGYGEYYDSDGNILYSGEWEDR